MSQLESLHRFLCRGRMATGDMPELVHLLGQLVGAQSVVITEGWGFDGDRVWTHQVPEEWQRVYPRIADQDPAGAALAGAPPGSWYVGERDNPGGLWDTEFGVLVSQWCRDVLVTVLPGPAGASTVIGLYRPLDQPRFADNEIALVQLVTPRLIQAFASRRAAALVEEPSETEAATITISFPSQRVTWSGRALAMLGELRSLGCKRLDAAAIATAMQLLHHCAGRRRWLGRLTVEATPLPVQPGEVARCCLILDELPATVELGPAAAVLTQRQRDVVRRRLAGDSLDTIAAALGIARETAREHLNDAYHRTGARSLADLAAILS